MVHVTAFRVFGTKPLTEPMTIWNKHSWNFNQNTNIFVQVNALENVVDKMSTMFTSLIVLINLLFSVTDAMQLLTVVTSCPGWFLHWLSSGKDGSWAIYRHLLERSLIRSNPGRDTKMVNWEANLGAIICICITKNWADERKHGMLHMYHKAYVTSLLTWPAMMEIFNFIFLIICTTNWPKHVNALKI